MGLVCVLYVACLGLFVLPVGVIGRLYSVIIAFLGHYLNNIVKCLGQFNPYIHQAYPEEYFS